MTKILGCITLPVIFLAVTACQSDKQDSSSTPKDFQSCSAFETNGQCVMDKNGERSEFASSADRPCQCATGFAPQGQANAGASAANAGAGQANAGAGQTLPTPGSQSYNDFGRRAIEQQIANVKTMGFPANVEQQIVANLKGQIDMLNGAGWAQPQDFNNLPNPGANFSWNENCSTNFVNGQCFINDNGQTRNSWANSFESCANQCG